MGEHSQGQGAFELAFESAAHAENTLAPARSAPIARPTREFPHRLGSSRSLAED